MALFDGSYMTYYRLAIVSIALSCTIFVIWHWTTSWALTLHYSSLRVIKNYTMWDCG